MDGFEHIPEGYVLMNPSGGDDYSACILLAPALVQAIDATLGLTTTAAKFPSDSLWAAWNTGPKLPVPGGLAPALVDELTAGGEHPDFLEDIFSGDAAQVFCALSNLWHGGQVLTCATRPRLLPEFIQAVQQHGNRILDLNLVTHWVG